MQHPPRLAPNHPPRLALLGLAGLLVACQAEPSALHTTAAVADPGGVRDLGGVPAEDSDAAADAAPDAEADAAPDAEADSPPDDAADGANNAAPLPVRCDPGWGQTFGPPREWLVGESIVNVSNMCKNDHLFVVAAARTQLHLELSALPIGTTVEVTSATGERLATSAFTGPSVGVVWTQPRSGEAVVRVLRPEGEATPTWEGLLSCVGGCGREATRYPIVLVHGMAGTDTYFGVLDYYYDVVDTLADAGFVAYTPVTRFIGHSELRAQQLAGQIDTILAETGAPKVHLIAHSQGGLDIRVLVSGLGYDDRVASMTTVSSPHSGLNIELPEWLTGMDFSAGYLQGEFRERYPDVESIPRFSWAGISCSRLDRSCKKQHGGEVVDLLLVATYQSVRLIHRDDGWEGANDGIVPVSSSIWGTFLGLLPADHFDEVGQIADGDGGAFDHRAFYLSEAHRLRTLELDLGL